MQALDFYVLSLFGMHLLETSIVLALFFKIALHKKIISKIFYFKVLLVTLLTFFFIYLGTYLLDVITIKILDMWIQFVSPITILVIIFYYCRFIVLEQNDFTNYFGERALLIAFISLILIYMQVAIFNFEGVPTIILVLRIIFP